MRKFYPHILFWLVYWSLIAYLEYLWVHDFSPAWSEKKIILRAIAGSFLYIIPHLALAYYLAYVGLVKLAQRKRGYLQSISLIIVPYLLAICIVVLFAHKIVLPLIYENIVIPTGIFVEPRKFLSLMIETAFPACVLVSTKFVRNELDAKEREKNLLKEKLSTELKLLKNQINPHFLFNTLNNIYALTRKKSDDAPEVVLKLSELLSFMLYESGNDTISVKREVEFLEDYIAIQGIRHTGRLSLSFTKDIDDPSQQIAPLLLMPLVENAFKHGAGENRYDSFIRLHLSLHKGKLSFEITNSFEETAETKQAATIGLSNTSRQLELLYKEQQLIITNQDQVFTVKVLISLDSYGKV